MLSDHGIDAAIRTLAERASFAVAIEGTAGRLPEHIETAAYFVVAEALTNVAKHANANRALIRIGRDPAGLTIEIDDDGVGAANPGQGSGLHGLADRVGALGGRFSVSSAPGGGTRIQAEIPCPLHPTTSSDREALGNEASQQIDAQVREPAQL